MLECFSAYNVEAYPGYARAGQQCISRSFPPTRRSSKAESPKQTDAAAAAKLRAQLGEMRSRIENIQASLAKSGEARYQQLSAEEKALHHAAFVTNAEDPDYHAPFPVAL